MSKWFRFDRKDKEFQGKREAKTKKEAWDKTVEKWAWRMLGFSPIGGTCGLCDKYYDDWCSKCPLSTKYYGIKGLSLKSCLPFFSEPDLEYLFLLFVREATKK